jgi:glutaredoxin
MIKPIRCDGLFYACALRHLTSDCVVIHIKLDGLSTDLFPTPMERPSFALVVLMLIAIGGGVHWYQTHNTRAQLADASDGDAEPQVSHGWATKPHLPIHLYTATWCGYCKHLKAGLDSSGVAYIDHDIDSTTEGRQFAQSPDYAGVPVTVIGKDTYDGYDAQGLAEFFGQAGYKVSNL